MQAPTKVVGRRIVAYLIDVLIFVAIVAVAWFALTTQQSGSCPGGGGGLNIGGNCRGFQSGDDAKRGIWFAVIVVGFLTLFAILPGMKGTSPGKAALGIRVVNDQGNPPGLFRGLVRGFFLVIDASLVGLIVALVTQRNQRLGDLVAGTFVVDKNAVGAIAGGPAQPAFAAPGGAQFGPPPTGQPAAPPTGQPAAPPTGQPAAPPTGQPAAPPTGQPAAPPPPQPQQQVAYKADWYPDPEGRARLRYWDGQRWTEHTSA
jgi:uncharacterized RDD family membrane protein YckC